MKLRALHEMASLVGWHNASGEHNSDREPFLSQDLKLLALDKTRRTIEQWLNANPTPYRYALAFGSNVDELMGLRRPGVITFVKQGNPASDPLTPHMILHTMAHAISAGMYASSDLADIVRDVLGGVLGRGFDEDEEEDDAELLLKLCMLLHMKAAEYTLSGSPKRFPNLHEACIEMLAVYIKNGAVKIGPNEFCDYHIDAGALRQLKSRLEAACDGFLSRSVGTVLFDDSV